MFRKFSFAAGLAVVLALAGCGGKADQDVSDDAAAAAAESAPAPDDGQIDDGLGTDEGADDSAAGSGDELPPEDASVEAPPVDDMPMDGGSADDAPLGDDPADLPPADDESAVDQGAPPDSGGY